jgi:phosphoglycerate-specific signal transduction histidine kinase
MSHRVLFDRIAPDARRTTRLSARLFDISPLHADGRPGVQLTLSTGDADIRVYPGADELRALAGLLEQAARALDERATELAAGEPTGA